MKMIYLDCGMGAAGDMLAAALLELTDDKNSFLERFDSVGIPGVRIICESTVKCGITGTHLTVLTDGGEETEHMHGSHSHHHHAHRSMADIGRIVGSLALPEKIKNDVLGVYSLIAQAESVVHGTEVSEIHFHEVGTMDAIADITLVCMLMDELGPDRVVASPVHVGSGTVRCAHGILPVPAPATAYLLKGVPIYGGSIESELCTPTGAALLRRFASDFVPMPLMRTKKIGCGMGKKDFERANCLRAFLGETDTYERDTAVELRCNIDDMTGEELGFACEALRSGGALDVWTEPISMKKSRPGVMLCVLCRADDRNDTVRRIFRNTSTLGIRESVCGRYVLSRSEEEKETPFGPVRFKKAEGYGVSREKPEYEDIARIASERGISAAEVRKAVQRTGS